MHLVGLTFVSVLVVFGTIMAPSVYAFFAIAHPTITPSSPISGQPFTVSGSTSPNGAANDHITVFTFIDTSAAHDCSSETQINTSPNTLLLSAGLTYSYTETISTPGFYCVGLSDNGPTNGPAIGGTLAPDESFVVGVAPIPEYPIGLPLLAILMVVGYGFIRRKISNKRHTLP